MAIRYLPNVPSATHHEVLQGAIKGYPSGPYDEWRALQSKQIDDLSRTPSHEVRLVDFTLNEFITYCGHDGAVSDMDTFNRFIFWKGSRQEH